MLNKTSLLTFCKIPYPVYKAFFLRSKENILKSENINKTFELFVDSYQKGKSSFIQKTKATEKITVK